MSEKTPRQLGREAEALRSHSYNIERRLVGHSQQLKEELEEVEYLDKIASGERDEGDVITDEEARELSRKSLKFIAELQPRADYFRGAAEARAAEAATHYKENAAGYHDLAVLEAALDGVHINVQQAKSSEEPTSAE